MTHDEDCRKRIDLLEEENRQLRRAAEEFGQLAERLNTALIAERRAETDRRRAARGVSDRRRDSGAYPTPI